MAEQYSDWVHNAWTEQTPKLYSSLGLPFSADGTRGSSNVPCVSALVYSTVCSSRPGESVQECFETLASIRDHARQTGGGVYADRRAR